MRRRVVLAVMIPAVVACSGRSDTPYPELEVARQAVEGVAGRRCEYISDPVVPASLDPVTRPGTRGAILLWGGDAAPTDSVDLSVRYGGDGRLVWVRAIHSNVAADRRVELERILTGGLSQEGPPEWGMRVRVVGGRVDAVLPSVVCPPERGAPTGRMASPMGTTREMQETWQTRGRQIEMAVGLDEMGRVTGVELLRGSGSRLMDQHAVDLARAFRYEPMLHDGIGVPSVIPVRLQVSRR